MNKDTLGPPKKHSWPWDLGHWAWISLSYPQCHSHSMEGEREGKKAGNSSVIPLA